MLPIFGFKLFGNPGAKLFRISPSIGQVLVFDNNAFFTTGSFYDTNTFGSPYAVQFGRYIYHLRPDLLSRYDTISGGNISFRNPPGFTYQNHYENSGGIYLSFDGTEWYLTYIYVNASANLRADRYRFSNQTWTTSGTFASAGDGQNPQFRYFFNNQVFFFTSGPTCYRYDTISMSAGTVSGFTGDWRATSMCMHKGNIYLATAASATQLNLYIYVGGAWNLVQSIAGLSGVNTTTPNRLFSDGTDMFLLAYRNVVSVGWRCYKIDGSSFATTDISDAVLPLFLRQSGLTISAFKGFHIDSHTDPDNPEIWLTYTAAWTTAGSSLAWYRWMGEAALMNYEGDAGEGGPDYFISYDWTGGGHYAWTPGEPYVTIEGAPEAVVGGKTRIKFRVTESSILLNDAPVNVQLQFAQRADPPRMLGTISNPRKEMVETFNTPGLSNWVAPAGVTSVQVECFGAGGGALQQGSFASGGGGGGAYARSTVNVVPGNSYDYFVGAGVVANHGQDTYFIDALTVMAKGGTGLPVNQNAGGLGGQASASVGVVKFSGGNGASGVNGNFIGGGGAGAGPSGNGANGGASVGGVGVFPAGSGGAPGVNGTSPGGGGGGGNVGVSTKGGDGRVVLTYVTAADTSVIDPNTVQVLAGEDKLWILDWHHSADGVPLQQRSSVTLKAEGA